MSIDFINDVTLLNQVTGPQQQPTFFVKVGKSHMDQN